MTSFSSRRSRSVYACSALVLALLAAMSLSACGGTDEDGEQGASTSETSTSAPSSPPATTSGEAATGNGTPIRISAGEVETTARVLDTATARDLVEQLPLTLTFRDHNNVEKTAPLPRELSLDGAPDGHDPDAGDIGYWAPDSDFVLYYDNAAPYFNGIVRIGQFEGDVEPISRLPDGARVTIERGG